MRFLLLIFSVPSAVYATCPDLTGRYRVDKDVEFGDSYIIELSQVGCTSHTEKIINDNGHSIGPITVVADGKMKIYTYNNDLAMAVFYRFTSTGFHAIETRMKHTDEFSNSTESLVTKNSDGSLTLERRDTNSDGVLKVKINHARRLP